MDSAEIVAKLQGHDRRTVARLISLVEDGADDLADVIRAITPLQRGAAVVGLTGSPGVGKSTLASALVGAVRAKGKTVSVLAVDPTSPFTGGALLGDRLRMQEHATDSGVFIRSMATRGRLGGLAWATSHALRILDAAGSDVIIVETVGAGQSEVEVAHAADTTVVVLAPGLGDAIQANKAGILEIADIFVVNKADKDESRSTVRDIRQMLHLGAEREWQPPVLSTVADQGSGIDEVWEAIEQHRAFLEESGELRRRRLSRAANEISEIAVTSMRRQMGTVSEGAVLDELSAQVVEGKIDPYAAADKLLAQVGR
jgi:GTPase